MKQWLLSQAAQRKHAGLGAQVDTVALQKLRDRGACGWYTAASGSHLLSQIVGLRWKLERRSTGEG